MMMMMMMMMMKEDDVKHEDDDDDVTAGDDYPDAISISNPPLPPHLSASCEPINVPVSMSPSRLPTPPL